MNWRRSGHLLRAHRVPVVTPDSGVITSVALNADWVVVGLANSRIHVFSAKTGVLSRTLIGHELGVWAVNLVSRGGERRDRRNKRPSGDNGKGKGRRRDDVGEDEDVNVMPSLTARLAGMSTASGPPGLDHLVPPSLRTALGLDNSPEPASDYSDYEDGVELEDEEDPGKRSDECCASEGWGQPNALVVSGGCDKVLRVWDVKTG